MRVFVSTSSRVEDEKYLLVAKDVANVLTSKTCDLITGGVSSGLMRQTFLEFKKAKGHTTVVTLDVYQEDLSEVEDSILVDNTFDRCKKIYELMDCALFLPGGTGTLSELFSMLEEARTLINKPLILYNIDGYFEEVLNILDNFIKLGFNKQQILDKIYVISSKEELDKKIEEIKRQGE